jgi:2-isopropylmalate synthase
MWDAFTSSYMADDANIRLISSEVSSGEKGTHVTAQVLMDGKHETISGQGNGPVDALVNGLREALGIEITVEDYHEHALTSGAEASAAAYVQAVGPGGLKLWGVGIHSSILDATLAAVISAANRLRDRQVG